MKGNHDKKRHTQIDNEVHLVCVMSPGPSQCGEATFINLKQKSKCIKNTKGTLYLHFRGWSKKFTTLLKKWIAPLNSS